IFPFTEEQVDRVARTEPTLRDMLQQFRHLFDHVIYGSGSETRETAETTPASRLPAEDLPPGVKSVIVGETPADSAMGDQPVPGGQQALTAPVEPRADSREPTAELWEQEVRAAKRRLEPEGALTGATRELQAGLGLFL